MTLFPLIFLTALVFQWQKYIQPSTIQPSTLQTSNDAVSEARKSFRQGQFAAAKLRCAEALKRDSANADGKKLFGTLLLFENKPEEARQYLLAAHSTLPNDTALAGMLAETYYRQDKFAQAALYLRSVGRKAFAEMLESFSQGNTSSGKTILHQPYKITSGINTDAEVVIKFVQTDPLPVVSMSVNGSAEALFILDTGGSALILDPDFAAKIGATEFGEESGTFAGGKKTPVRYGRVDSVGLGGITVQNVPINILNTKKFSVVTGGKVVSGVLGTVFLYHFLTTIDYLKGQIVLRKRGTQKPQTPPNAVSMPFWMSGDHFIVVQGSLQNAEKESAGMLFFVDTGLAGAGFTYPESTWKEANLKPLGGQTLTGTGGAGAVSMTPFMIPALHLGGNPVKRISAKNVLGLAGPFPAALEYSQGYRIGGLVSHSVFRPYSLTLDFETMTMTLAQ
ncbi:MAG: aspartyl protease family protein [Candidatus Kapabacteria bacterium]|nr:aspartyl protease family protein [Candidatus Kapabacteria bacterium]